MPRPLVSYLPPQAKADPKPRQRKRLSRTSYNKLVRELLAKRVLCECGCGRRAQSAHHVVGRHHGDDLEENLMVLAGDGVRLCHGAFTSKMRTWDPEREVYVLPEEVARGLRRTIETVRVDVLAYVLMVKGAGYLDKHYPR